MTDKTPEPRKGRLRLIVKRTAWTVVGMVLLLALYVGGFGATQWYKAYTFYRADADPDNVSDHLIGVALWADDTFYVPLHSYADSEWPGAETLFTFLFWSIENGTNDEYVSWEDAYETAHPP